MRKNYPENYAQLGELGSNSKLIELKMLRTFT